MYVEVKCSIHIPTYCILQIKVTGEYPELHTMALKVVLLFPFSYFCEPGFSALTAGARLFWRIWGITALSCSCRDDPPLPVAHWLWSFGPLDLWLWRLHRVPPSSFFWGWHIVILRACGLWCAVLFRVRGLCMASSYSNCVFLCAQFVFPGTVLNSPATCFAVHLQSLITSWAY